MKHSDSEVLTLARSDRTRYLAALAAPLKTRPALLVVLAFDAEIARIPKVVSEPMLGRIRLQWWVDVLPSITGGRPPGHAVAQALGPLGLETQALCALVQARSFVWDGDPSILADVLAYAQATGGAVQALWMQQLGVEDAEALLAAREIGSAWVLANRNQDEQARKFLDAARARSLSRAVQKAAFPALVLARLVDRQLRLGAKANDGVGAVLSVLWGKLIGKY